MLLAKEPREKINHLLRLRIIFSNMIFFYDLKSAINISKGLLEDYIDMIKVSILYACFIGRLNMYLLFILH